MAHGTDSRLPSARSGGCIPNLVTTTVFISNLHCPSCVDSIEESLSLLQPPPDFVSPSIVSHSIVVRHLPSLPVNDICDALEVAGFDIHSIFQDDSTSLGPVEVPRDQLGPAWLDSLEEAVGSWRATQNRPSEDLDMAKRQKHVDRCEHCQEEAGGVTLDSNHKGVATVSEKEDTIQTETIAPKSPSTDSFVVIEQPTTPVLYKANLALSGMTCSACVSSITHAVQQHPWVRSIDVNLLTSSATVVFDDKHRVQEIVSTIEDTGFDAAIDAVVDLQHPALRDPPIHQVDKWKATYAIGGMTCSSCVGNVTNALKQYSWIETAEVNLLSNTATIVFHGKDHLPNVQEAIEDAGYDATLDSVVIEGASAETNLERSISIEIEGMYCQHCPSRITRALKDQWGEMLTIEDPPLSIKRPILNIKYVPEPPAFTVRHICEIIASTDAAFQIGIYHPPTIEDRAKQLRHREKWHTIYRLGWIFANVCPTFVFGVIFMDWVPESNSIREMLMQPTWVGNVNAIEWGLFICATCVYLFGADVFHRKAIKQILALWRPGSRTPILRRFYRFGSMDTLLCLGTSIAYWASFIKLMEGVANKVKATMTDSYFDTVVFLTFFITIGRAIEAYSKAKTGDAVEGLIKLRPVNATLIDEGVGDCKILTDLLEVGDVVRVPHGSSPAFDGTIIEGTSDFDESSLSGESRPVTKAPGDTVYSGTINKGSPVKIKLTTVSGTSMLDQIIAVVREGQTRRAPVERIADKIVGVFVPIVVATAILTWLLWMILGYTGVIPDTWKDDGSTWVSFALRFAIAEFVVACPCGIGLAAPTALFVGGGIAAKRGILVRGGGEAFQEASSVDCVVFDKTGTLTKGGDPAVTDHEIVADHDKKIILGAVRGLEENSSHPVARALVSFCAEQEYQTLELLDVDEIPGRGLKGAFRLDNEKTSPPISAIIGNETFMSDYKVEIPEATSSTLEAWKSQGKSVALIAIGIPARRGSTAAASSVYSSSASTDQPPTPTPHTWILAGIFSISDPLRPEAAATVSELQKMKVSVWMLSGDNETTARAVGAQVGIPATNIIAGVLPDQKAEKIRYLQRSMASAPTRRLFGIGKPRSGKRATVAMVGDGINDSPALSAADVSIAIGSGSDIAISSASFVLITSKLTTIITLLDLSKKVFHRVKFNFGWACVYNVCAMPIAAGAIFAITTGTIDCKDGTTKEGHFRLDPVWASLAMALSSISVVCSSLALKLGVRGVGFVARRIVGDGEEQ